MKTKIDNRKSLSIVLNILLTSVPIILVFVVVVYRSIFNGGLSANPSDWTTFGSFFGGIFSPIISFITLIALIITIKLQLLLINNQTREFSSLFGLQKNTLDAQNEQLMIVKESSENDKIVSHKQTLLTLINQQITLRQTIIDRCTKAVENLVKHKLNYPKTVTGTEIEEIIKSKKTTEEEVDELSRISMIISISKYKSIGELDTNFLELYDKVRK